MYGRPGMLADTWKQNDPLITLTLPWPPSANTYVRHVSGGRHYLTPAAKRFRESVCEIVAENRCEKLSGRLHVYIRAFPATRRKVDLDNRLKPLLDALQHAGCFEDDEAIDKLTIERAEIVKGGQCRVLIMRAGVS